MNTTKRFPTSGVKTLLYTRKWKWSWIYVYIKEDDANKGGSARSERTNPPPRMFGRAKTPPKCFRKRRRDVLK